MAVYWPGIEWRTKLRGGSRYENKVGYCPSSGNRKDNYSPGMQGFHLTKENVNIKQFDGEFLCRSVKTT